METSTHPQLTIEVIETVHVLETDMWTAWIIGNSKVWGTGKTEIQAIVDMQIYQGLLVADEALRIVEGRQVWQDMGVKA